MHCGPFANIAHGNNSVVADRVRIPRSSPTTLPPVTEARFGLDMDVQIVCGSATA